MQLNDKFIPKKNCFDFDVNNIKFSDLTYNYEYYLEGKEIDVFFENDERKKFREDIYEFVKSNGSYKYILCPCGIGKT